LLSVVLHYGKQYPADSWTTEKWRWYEPLVDAAKEFDTAAGEPDCELDDKVAWFEHMKERIAHLEREAELLERIEELKQRLGEQQTVPVQGEEITDGVRTWTPEPRLRNISLSSVSGERWCDL
jgi:hypothetical protein